MPRQTGRTIVFTLLATVLIAAVAVIGLVYSGAYNVAATAEHTPLVRWALSTVQERSVAARADDVPDPPATDSAALVHGFEHYDAMCVGCHAAPGVERGEYGKGMNPTPPELSEEARELSSKQLFWITKHGIKLAGMPAFGPTHSDPEIWSIVAFVERLPDMTAEEYQGWAQRYAVGAAEVESSHTHAPGTPDHSH
jgi:mono/diheme cytochrome c family protein